MELGGEGVASSTRNVDCVFRSVGSLWRVGSMSKPAPLEPTILSLGVHVVEPFSPFPFDPILPPPPFSHSTPLDEWGGAAFCVAKIPYI